MGVALPVLPARGEGCRRCGSCCEYIALNHSPKKLREGYFRARERSDVAIVRKMLEGRCLGKLVIGSKKTGISIRYVYGPCANLTTEVVDGVEVACCAIHETRPRLCSGYPYYTGLADELPVETPNPGYMKGCGYNKDWRRGKTPQGILSALKPLDEDEL